MVDITHKSSTLREATALAVVNVSRPETIALVEARQVPKGDIFEMARAAGLLGIKKTPDLLPDCHPLPIEYAAIRYEIEGLSIHIYVTVRTIYKTGVEVEAMHGASVSALTIYDMLKPVDPAVEIGTIKLLSKTGGKSSFAAPVRPLRAQVVVCSDSISRGEKQDRSGKLIETRLRGMGLQTEYAVIPDEAAEITRLVQETNSDLLIFTGGTGVSPRDVTPDALIPLLDLRLPGVEEQMRRYGQERMPYAMLSRSVAGIRGQRVILALPGSAKGAEECMEAVFPHLLHLFSVLGGEGH
ncbi:MAG: bifunctional molybdenum cofactor biosynthesis protein MoaC/MoaB, partial [Bacteroidetes bacterium]